MTSTALITGVTGQDGSYLAELLLAKGYRIVGLTRGVGHGACDLPLTLRGRVELRVWDLIDQVSLRECLEQVRPDEIYNLAAYSSGAGMYDDPVGMAEVNGVSVARLLEAIRHINPKIRFCQASSREIFGNAQESPQTELTPRNPRSPYGAAKLYADCMVQQFRERYGIYACSAILFNHESPRRSVEFVTRKITQAAARIKQGLAHELQLGNLDAQRDWGYAGDYVRAMWLMLQQKAVEDYVIATGFCHTVREFCELSFARLGLDYRDYVREDATVFRPAEPHPLVGSAAKAHKNLGWRPELGFQELVHAMVDADMKALQSET